MASCLLRSPTPIMISILLSHFFPLSKFFDFSSSFSFNLIGVDGYVMKNRYAPPESMYSIRNHKTSATSGGNTGVSANRRKKRNQNAKKGQKTQTDVAHEEASELVSYLSNHRLEHSLNNLSSTTNKDKDLYTKNGMKLLLLDNETLSLKYGISMIKTTTGGGGSVSHLSIKKEDEQFFQWERIGDTEWTKPYKTEAEFGILPENHIYQKYDWFTKYNISQVNKLLRKGKVHNRYI